MCGSLWYIGYKFSQSNAWSEDFSWPEVPFGTLIIVLALMPINWLLECYKWYFLAHNRFGITFYEAFKGVIAGLSMGLITPHSLGDYLARYITIRPELAPQSVGMVLICRISQFAITLFYGVIGFYVYLYTVELQSGFLNESTIWITVAIFVLSMVLLSAYPWLLNKGFFLKIRAFLDTFLHSATKITFGEHVWILTISWLRHMVFTLPYFLILMHFRPDLPWGIVASGIWLVFLIKSIFPSFNALSDIGTREAAALFVLSPLGFSLEEIIASGLWVWIINIVVPSLWGLVLVGKQTFGTKIAKVPYPEN